MSKIGELIQKFIMSDPNRALNFFSSRSVEWWKKQEMKKALGTFHQAAELVPAYKDFLSKNGIKDHNKIKTIEDFKKYVPITTKENYILRYGLKDRTMVPFKKYFLIATTSGTTGEAVIWPMGFLGHKMGALFIELLYRNAFQIHKRPTLGVVCYSLGNWGAGQFMTFTFEQIHQRKDLDFTIATPGSNLEDALFICRKLLPYYSQIILAGYPSFIKDLIEIGRKRGIEWEKYNIKICLGGESASLSYINNLSSLLKKDPNDFSFLFDIYANADVGGVTGLGDTLVSLIRLYFYKDAELQRTLTGGDGSLEQTMPLMRFVEIINNSICVTFSGPIPVIRYDTRDMGTVLDFDMVFEFFNKHNINLKEEILRVNPNYKILKLPFLFIKGRDNAISLDGANVYPENLEPVIGGFPEVNSFKISKKEDENSNYKFYIYLELKEGAELNLKVAQQIDQKYHKLIVESLKKHNPDYRRSLEDNSRLCDPEIIVRRFKDGEFKPNKSGKNKLVI
jgi:phenylacetate-CoA ligase